MHGCFKQHKYLNLSTSLSKGFFFFLIFLSFFILNAKIHSERLLFYVAQPVLMCVWLCLTKVNFTQSQLFPLFDSMMSLRNSGCSVKWHNAAVLLSIFAPSSHVSRCGVVLKIKKLMEGTFPRPAWRRSRGSLHLALQWPPKTAVAENEKGCFITRAQGKDIQRHVFKHSCHYIFS